MIDLFSEAGGGQSRASQPRSMARPVKKAGLRTAARAASTALNNSAGPRQPGSSTSADLNFVAYWLRTRLAHRPAASPPAAQPPAASAAGWRRGGHRDRRLAPFETPRQPPRARRAARVISPRVNQAEAKPGARSVASRQSRSAAATRSRPSAAADRGQKSKRRSAIISPEDRNIRAGHLSEPHLVIAGSPRLTG